jgi:hypothetical protein
MTKKPRPKEGVRHPVSTYYRGTATSSDRGNRAFCPGRSRRRLRVLVGKSDATILHPKRNYSGNGKDEQFV